MATYKEITDRIKEVSGQVSAQTRASGLGLLAISWALLTAHDDPLKTMASHANRHSILAMAVIAFFLLACDLLQYVFYTRAAMDTLRRAEDSETKEASYDYGSKTYKAGRYLYFAKFGFLIVGAILLALIFIALFRS